MKSAYILAFASVGKAVELYGSPFAKEIFRELENHTSPLCNIHAVRSKALREENYAWLDYEAGSSPFERWLVARALVYMTEGIIRNNATKLMDAKTCAIEALYRSEK